MTETHLPTAALGGLSMDAKPVDVDEDGDTDIVIANEHRPNILLINDGSGRFVDESADRIPRVGHDSEDIGVADFDGDGDLDILFASIRGFVPDADPRNRLLINDGTGTYFDATAERLPAGEDRSFDGDLIETWTGTATWTSSRRTRTSTWPPAGSPTRLTAST